MSSDFFIVSALCHDLYPYISNTDITETSDQRPYIRSRDSSKKYSNIHTMC